MARTSQHPEWLRRLRWLRFVPVKLHLVLFWIGAAAGQHVGGHAGLIVGIILGIAIGVPLQLLKYLCRRAVMAERSSNDDRITAWLRQRTPIQPAPVGLDLDYGRNMRQFVAGLVMAVVAAAIACLIPGGDKALLALVAGILGFVAGVFLCGAVLLVSHYVGEFRRRRLTTALRHHARLAAATSGDERLRTRWNAVVNVETINR